MTSTKDVVVDKASLFEILNCSNCDEDLEIGMLVTHKFARFRSSLISILMESCERKELCFLCFPCMEELNKEVQKELNKKC